MEDERKMNGEQMQNKHNFSETGQRERGNERAFYWNPYKDTGVSILKRYLVLEFN